MSPWTSKVNPPLPAEGWIVHHHKRHVKRVTGVRRTNASYAHSDQGSFEIYWFRPTRKEALELLRWFWQSQKTRSESGLQEANDILADIEKLLAAEENGNA